METNTKTIKPFAVLCSDGSPTATDRLIASNMGYAAVQALYQGQRAHVTAFNKGAIEMVPLSACLEGKNESTDAQLEFIRALAI